MTKPFTSLGFIALTQAFGPNSHAQAPAAASAAPAAPAPATAPVIAPSPASAPAAAPDGFTVGDIRVEGLQRISEGTVYNYLPVNIGDKLDSHRIGEALRAMYATGFFKDVELRRDGTTLVVVVIERPSIESFELKGNKDIKTEDLQKSLKNVGLSQGKTFDRSVLEEVKQYLTDQYYSRGKYAVRVDTKVTDVPGNKVKVAVNIKEGKRARIRQINIVGNTRYKDKKILESFELKTPHFLSFYKQDDRYSRESLQGDLEKLRSYYMDRGYANFQIDSTQVAIAPEKDDIYITANITEGDVFKISEVKLAGTMVVPEAQLKALLLVKPGDTFNRKAITTTQELISNRLGADGYAFAKIDPVPTPDNDKKTVSLTFFIEPGNRVYVRHINFVGTTGINDETLRREMRQLEGSWLSNAAVERSKERLMARLPFVEKAEYETKPVPGSTDLVDVDFQIKEGLPGQFGGGVGYSASQSFMLNGNFVHSNFMGRGERIAAEINSGRYSKSYSFSHTNPYTTIDGISRTLSFSYRDITQFVSASSDFSTKQLSAAAIYGYPITEFQSVQFGFSVNRSELITSQNSADQARNWVSNNGKHYQTTAQVLTGGTVTNPIYTNIDIFGSKFNTFQLTAGWSYDTRNRALFADRGTRHSLSLNYALPGSDVEYYTVNYEFLKYLRLTKKWTMSFNVQLDYGDSLGSTTALPPYLNFFAGGPDTVRGYRESRLGPKDSNTFYQSQGIAYQGNPYGGNMRLVARTELLFPTPEKWRSSARIAWFYDIGNVFQTNDSVVFKDKLGQPITYRPKYDKLKHSTGFAVQWLAPLGVFRFSYAFPLNAYKGDKSLYEDEQERFQFSIGQAF
jgi:outer membrane protein insertion porin family